eukprot:TRINITY_DN29227_c0_g2_i1.p1 TRINITY_DN29227_c0_g2~~TRINITY_DN29227_c0_g2_i1.p1  ORF type:complete len:555 (-),score=85.54 TRINITY_DN29227_c0_g2_i1:21-1685(-)
MRRGRWPPLRRGAIVATCIAACSPLPCISRVHCEWHFDYFRGKVNVSNDPWRFDIHSSCTAVSLMTLVWGSIDDAGAAALAESLQRSPQLEELSIGYNHIGEHGARALAQALRHVPKLRVLSLPWNNIGDVGAEALAASLENVPLLTDLNLFWNAIGSKGIAALAQALQRVPRLKFFGLSWNDIGDVGAAALGAALSTDGAPQLEDLRADWANVGDQGAEALAGGLQSQEKLSALRVKWNAFGDVGATAIARSVVHVEAARGDRGSLACYGVARATLEAAGAGISASKSAKPASSSPEVSPTPPPPPKAAYMDLADAITCISRSCRALVVANTKYSQKATQLAASDDAVRLAESLQRQKFTVTKLFDATRKQAKAAIKAFIKQLDPDAVALVAYSGYALGNESLASMLPVDYPFGQPSKAKDKGISIQASLRDLVANRSEAVTMLVVDAVRVDPASASPSGTSPSSQGALLPPTGALMAFATREESIARSDGEVTLLQSFAEELDTNSGLLAEQLFRRVGRRVGQRHDGTANFWTASALSVDFVPNPGNGRPEL